MQESKETDSSGMHGSHNDQYNKLQAYINEIMTSDRGTDVCLQISQEALEKEKKRVFSRLYICFNAAKVSMLFKWLVLHCVLR